MKSSHPSVYLNNITVISTSLYKHFGTLLDDKLSSEYHLKLALNKVKDKTDRLLKFQQNLLRQYLVTI